MVERWYRNCIKWSMKSPVVSLTTETDLLDVADQEPEVEAPTLPLKTIDPQEFEKRVLALRMEYEIQKPAGIFF